MSGGACSYGELRTAEQLADRLGETGREILWRPLWVPGDPGLHSALVAVAATLLGLASINWPVPAGLLLTLLLALWSLELGGVAGPSLWCVHDMPPRTSSPTTHAARPGSDRSCCSSEPTCPAADLESSGLFRLVSGRSPGW